METEEPRGPFVTAIVWIALAVALAALAGSLSLTWGLNLRACPLCFYQRTFVMSLTALLATGLLFDLASAGRLAVLGMPLAVAGLGVALFHVNLERTGKLECPAGLFDLGSAPQQSLAAFAVIVLLLLLGMFSAGLSSGKRWTAIFGTVVIGAALAAGSCTSNPPMPAAPQQPYTQPPDICRPPYQAPG